MKKVTFAAHLACCLALCVGWITPAWATPPLGGLAVAVSPAGDVLAAAGDSRTLYILDAAKMEVTRRAWLGVAVVDLAFAKDGKHLLAEDTDGTLHLIDAATWAVTKKEAKSERMSAAPAADLVATLNPDSNGSVIRFLSMTDLSEKGKVTLAKGVKVSALGLNPEGTRLSVWTEPATDDSEPKAQPPAGLKGVELEEFRLKNDGKTSHFLWFAAPAGTPAGDQKSFYSPSVTGTRIFFQADHALVVNYMNLNARVTPTGEATIFQLDNSFNYGIGASPDQKILLTGGLSNGTYTKTADLSKAKFQADKLPSWPEYFKSFTVAADGTAYGATTAHRLIRIKPDGSFDKGFPVY